MSDFEDLFTVRPATGGQRQRPHEEAIEQGARELVRAIRAFRTEIGLLLVPVGVAVLLAAGLRESIVTAGWQAVFLTVVLPLAASPSRRWVRRQIRYAGIRRRWETAIRTSKPPLDPKCARPGRITDIVIGERMSVRLSTIGWDALGIRHNALESAMGVRLMFARDEQRPSHGTVTLVQRSIRDLTDWPVGDEVSLWDRIPFGVDEEGRDVSLRLTIPTLFGGVTGSGKSNAMSLMVASAALDPTAKLYLLDAKRGLEFDVWADCAERIAFNLEEGVDVLREAQRVMFERADQLKAAAHREHRTIRKVTREDGWPLIVVAIDELAEFTSPGAGADKKLVAEFCDLLTSLVRIGRAPGVIVVAATQKPTVAAVPEQARDNFAQRCAFRTTTPSMSDVILGQGHASEGYDASKIGSEDDERGTGWLLADEGRPRRMKTYYLDDEAVYALAQRAAAVRRETRW